MRTFHWLMAAGLASAFALSGQVKPPELKLKIGDAAPDFTLPSTAGKDVTLSSFRNQKNVVLAFIFAAFTGG